MTDTKAEYGDFNMGVDFGLPSNKMKKDTSVKNEGGRKQSVPAPLDKVQVNDQKASDLYEAH